MNSKFKFSFRTLLAIIFFTLFVLSVWLLFLATKNRIVVLTFSIVFFGLSAFFVWLEFHKKGKTSPENNLTYNQSLKTDNFSTQTESVSVSTIAPSKTPDGEMNYNLFEDVTDGTVLCYEYEENLCLSDGAFDYIPGNGGKSLAFQQEPENPHDEKAVAVYLNGTKIGYIYRGTVQDMCNDYIKRGWHVSGYLNKYSVDDNKATYKIGFYKPLDIFESKRFSLSKIKKKIDEYTTRKDNLLNCNEGDFLTIEYEDADNCFVVFNDIYEEVGELPKSAANFINENNHKKIIGILDVCNENDDGITEAEISVYLVK